MLDGEDDEMAQQDDCTVYIFLSCLSRGECMLYDACIMHEPTIHGGMDYLGPKQYKIIKILSDENPY